MLQQVQLTESRIFLSPKGFRLKGFRGLPLLQLSLHIGKATKYTNVIIHSNISERNVFKFCHYYCHSVPTLRLMPTKIGNKIQLLPRLVLPPTPLKRLIFLLLPYVVKDRRKESLKKYYLSNLRSF